MRSCKNCPLTLNNNKFLQCLCCNKPALVPYEGSKVPSSVFTLTAPLPVLNFLAQSSWKFFANRLHFVFRTLACHLSGSGSGFIVTFIIVLIEGSCSVASAAVLQIMCAINWSKVDYVQLIDAKQLQKERINWRDYFPFVKRICGLKF